VFILVLSPARRGYRVGGGGVFGVRTPLTLTLSQGERGLLFVSQRERGQNGRATPADFLLTPDS